MDSSDLVMVKAIAELGSISKAAEQLHLSQPTLSKRLSRLEDTLSLALFHRHNGGMRPTEAAHYLITQGQPLQDRLQAMQRHIEMLANLETGNLKLGIGPIIEQLYFPKVLLEFTQRHPRIDISLVTEGTDRMLALLLSGGIDVAIGPFLHDELPEDLIIRRVQSARLVFVARQTHPVFEQDTPVTLDRLNDYPVIAPEIPEAMEQSADLPIPMTPNITCVNYHIAKAMVLNSDYVTGGPIQLFSKELASGELREIPTQLTMDWTSYCLIKPESLHAPPVKRFLAIFNSYLET